MAGCLRHTFSHRRLQSSLLSVEIKTYSKVSTPQASTAGY